MGFCLLRRDGESVALIVSSVFQTRAEALGEVSRLSAGEGIGADEVFVVDLDAAMPVLIVAPAPEEPSGGAVTSEAPVSGPAHEESTPAADTTESPEAAVIEVEAAIAEAVLGLNESEIPPYVDDMPVEESFGEQQPVQSWPWDVAEAPDVTEHAQAESPKAEPDEAAVAPVEVAEADVRAGVEPEVPEAEMLEPEAFETGQPEPEALEPGEVPDEVDPTEDVPEPSPADQPTPEEEDLPDEVSGLLADLEEIVPSVPAAPEPSEPAASTSPEAAAEIEPELDPAPPEEPAKAYEPGTSDLTELTCEDCIYLNTCPKKDESDPSNCGSFQWKSI